MQHASNGSFRPTVEGERMSGHESAVFSTCGVISHSSHFNPPLPSAARELIRPEALSLDALYYYRLYLSQLTFQQATFDPAATVFPSTRSAFGPPPATSALIARPKEHANVPKPESNSKPKTSPSAKGGDQKWLSHYEKKPAEGARRSTVDPNNNEEFTINTDPATKLQGSLTESFCQVCGDNSSGLHYGIFSQPEIAVHFERFQWNEEIKSKPTDFSCEGCKSFFKRSVQRRRLYVCENAGECIVNRQLRNRCAFCRFTACLRQGMQVVAVREDRMPGGRNGSAIYNLYKLKYRKRRRSTGEQAVGKKHAKMADDWAEDPLRHYRSTPTNKNLIEELIEIDRLESLISLRGLQIRTPQQDEAEESNAAERLSRIGDEIVEKLVEWTKVLPFYHELPVEMHTHLLTQRWAELVLLSSCFYAFATSPSSPLQTGEGSNGKKADESAVSFNDPNTNLHLLQRRLSVVLGREIPIEHVRKEAGPLVEKFTSLLHAFGSLKMTLEGYVCLKAITLLHYTAPQESEEEGRNATIHDGHVRRVSLIQDQFVKALQIHLSQCEDGPRLSDILTWLPMLHSASSVLLHSKMFYVPFLVCKEPTRLRFGSPPSAPSARPPSTTSLKLEAEETDCSSSDASAPHNRAVFAHNS